MVDQDAIVARAYQIRALHSGRQMTLRFFVLCTKYEIVDTAESKHPAVHTYGIL